MTSTMHDAAGEVRRYLFVFGVLLALTLVTVGISYLVLPPALTVAAALAIAGAKAALVAMFFMHLKGERPMVCWPLALTAFMLIALIVFTLWTEADKVGTTQRTSASAVTAPRP